MLLVYYLLIYLTLANGFVKKPASIQRKSSLKNHNWYVIGENDKIIPNKAEKIMLKDNPIAVWKDNSNNYGAISDICSNRGASLSNGRIDPSVNCLVCPYHTFKFNQCGRLVQTPGKDFMRHSTNFNKKTDVAHYKIISLNDWIYICDTPIYDMTSLLSTPTSEFWIEPEAHDSSFRCVYLSKDFNIDARTVTENSLDVLHISEVHDFGNKKRPLPFSDKIEEVSEGHVRVSYEYESGEESIPNKIFKINRLMIENEYILPHYTVARVHFGPFVNTIVTSALPISKSKTRLFVKAYRNNWVYNIPFVNYIFDEITKYYMEKTLGQDKAVIDTIYYEHRDGNFITKYDELVKRYREDYHTYVLDKQL